ncbi:GNAT family N-acetyltransferase [Fictibacillus aquaticus]|uniref:Alanine acetyltransferase n=1 Tax=Fictibacillus aquaticus TaxID=2021314 RepID=A0A235F5U6_9BACL|nr:GNAT family N-acetyltransferase [Fictibacillus aquaticus]OYD56640.1 alanine acetyltransferase [Fictibacillus aquaticus]
MNIQMLFAEFPVLSSEYLELKRIEAGDLDDVFAIYSNERVFAYCGILPKSNKAVVQNMIGYFDRDFHKQTRIKWGIFVEGRLAGIIEAFDFSKKVEMVTIGYFLAESYWGKGIATEAVRLLVEFLFEKGEFNRIQAEVMPENTASKHVLVKNGFICEGTLRQATLWVGKGIVDLEIYSMLKSEFSELKTTKKVYVR